jgi:penicillin amidase
MRSKLVNALGLIVTIILVGQSSSHVVESQSAQSGATTLRLPGLKQQVTVRRDKRGIPYISAGNDLDLAFAQGYVTASDRLWQMDLLRRSARGELAEILGVNALEEDKRHRTWGFAKTAEAEAAQASPKARIVLDAYAKGVNAYIASLDAKGLPPEFQILQYQPKPWSPADSLVVVKLFFESLSNTWRLDIMRQSLADLPPEKLAKLLPERTSLDVLVIGTDTPKKAGRPFFRGETLARSSEVLRSLEEEEKIQTRTLSRVGLHAESLAASNNWVVSGKHTASGKPLLSDDPHLSPSAPPIWYMVHLTAPGVRVAGVTAAGLPGVIIGHNEHIAWGFTNVGPDVQDLYVEKFDPQNPNRYQTPSGWRDAEIRREVVKVRKNLTETTTDDVNLDVTVTRNGPIVLESGGKRYALRWTALDPKLSSADNSYALNRARNWSEFTNALKTFTAPMQNIVYGDTAGHIGYYAAGMVPIRSSGDGSVPNDGSTDAGQWTGYIPFEKLPHVFDPPSGIIVTANQRVVGTSYPYFLTRSWAQPYRAKRIMDLLQQKKKMTADDFRTVLGDVYSIAGANFAQKSAKILRPSLKSPEDDALAKTISAFEKWDGLLKTDSTEAPYVAQMRIAFRTKIINAAIGPERARIFGWSNFDTTLDWIITEQPREWLPKEFSSYSDLLRASYNDARQAMTRSMSEDETKWTWGNMVKARYPHPLAVVPLIGSQFTIQPFPQNGTGFMAGATVNVGAAVSMRLIADPSDWDKTQQGITLGQSGLPSSPHWSDQLEDWKAVTPPAFPFTEPAIAKATKSTIVLEPGN